MITVLATDSRLRASSGLSVRVPALGLGIKPLGPRVRAKGKSLGMVAGVAIKTSKSIWPSLMLARIVSFKITIFLLAVSRWGKVMSPTLPMS